MTWFIVCLEINERTRLKVASPLGIRPGFLGMLGKHTDGYFVRASGTLRTRWTHGTEHFPIFAV